MRQSACRATRSSQSAIALASNQIPGTKYPSDSSDHDTTPVALMIGAPKFQLR